VIERRDDAAIGVITIGSCDLRARSLDQLADAGCRRTSCGPGIPFVAQVRAFVEEHEHCFVVEQNRDAQLRSLIAIETAWPSRKCIRARYGGFPSAPAGR